MSTTWKIEPCDGPTGIALDRATNRIFSGCSNKSVVVNVATGKVVAELVAGRAAHIDITPFAPARFTGA